MGSGDRGQPGGGDVGPARGQATADGLTASGRELGLVVGALQQWGDAHVASPVEPAVAYRMPDGHPVAVRFVDDRGAVLPANTVLVERTASHAARPAPSAGPGTAVASGAVDSASG